MNLLKNRENTKKTDQFNILIVDDCRVSSLSLSKLLMLLGFKSISYAKSYQQALQMCSKKHYSLLFIDYHLEQVLNGSELYDLLREKGFIQPYTRVITISGDNTTQTVLSTLSKGNGDYLCKPISQSILSYKMADAYQEFQFFKYLYFLKKEGNNADILKEKTISLAKNKNLNELDLFLFDLFIPNDKENLIKLCEQPEFINRRNYILTKLQLEAELELTTPSELIDKTESLCRKHPLFASAFDFLSQLQIKQLRYEDALFSAHTALDLTPSVPSRSLQAMKLALSCNNKVYFLKSSHLLANHLPIADQNWGSYVAECFSYYESYIQNCQSESDKKQLRLEQKNFVRRSEYRLTETQKIQLSVLFSFSECKQLITNGDIIKAKQITLKVVQPFFDNLHRLNSVVLIELLYLLSFFGELWLLERVSSVIKTKHRFNDYCTDYLNILKNDSELKESILLLSYTINQIDNHQNKVLPVNELKNNLDRYQKTFVQFPYSSEVIIGILEYYIALSIDNPTKISAMVSLIKDMPLSQNLMDRRDVVLKALHTHDNFIEEKSATSANSTLVKHVITNEQRPFKTLPTK